jgi:hypothetical protein
VSRAFKDPSDLKVFKVSKVTLVHRDRQESKDFKVPLDQSDRWAHRAMLDPWAFRVSKVFKDLPVSRVSKAFREIPEHRAHKACKAKSGHKDQQVKPELKVLSDHRDLKEKSDPKVPKAFKGKSEPQDLRALSDRKACKVTLVPLDPKVHQDLRVLKDQPDRRAPKARSENPDSWGQKVSWF